MPSDFPGPPSWRQQGRTGPNGPRYASRKDRATVRRGGTPGGPPKKGCCAMAAALRSVKRGQFRLARRYAALSVRLLAAKLA